MALPMSNKNLRRKQKRKNDASCKRLADIIKQADKTALKTSDNKENG